MDSEILHAVTIAAFFHDLGKFAERAYAVEAGEKEVVKQDYRYVHAHHTELALLELFSAERLEREAGGRQGVTILNLAARHHKPRSGFELLIAEADRIASAHERAEGDDSSRMDSGSREKKSRTPMISTLSRVRRKARKNDPVTDWRYRINKGSEAFSLNYANIYPVPGEQYTADAVQKDYKPHWRKFREAIRPTTEFGLDIIDHFPTLLAICREYQWCLPATTRMNDLADSSLFDHQKVTAALAACLYVYHADLKDLETNNDTNKAAITNREDKKYLLFCGDISGIQNFIYRISSKGAFRTLKGKSFFVQLLAEILADEFVDACRLTAANILYASGGKFYLLLPNTERIKEKTDEISDIINHDLFKGYDGNLYIRTGYVELSGNDLRGESSTSLYQAWDDLTRKLVFEDRNRYQQLVGDNYDEIFGVKTDGHYASCPVCSGTMRKEKDTVCRSCRKMEEIGRQLPGCAFIVTAKERSALNQRYLLQIRNNYIWFVDKMPNATADLQVLAINNPDFFQIPAGYTSSIVNCVPFMVGSNLDFDRETFDEIAQKARGAERLGILRMDVDNLGKIFSEGLENYYHEEIKKSEQFHSLGRITTMSWLLSTFFGVIVPNLVRQNEDWADRATAVYSGGDDFFLLGAWDALPHIAVNIVDEFEKFTCCNRSFSLSGGMVLTGGKFPIYKSAEMAGEAEEKAKHNRTAFQDGEVGKESFTFLDTPMHWREFKEISDMQKQLVKQLTEKKYHALLGRLRDISASWRESKEALERSSPTMNLKQVERQLAAEKWRWRMVYSLARFGESQALLREIIRELQEMILSPIAGTAREGIALLGVLARWCELEIRK